MTQTKAQLIGNIVGNVTISGVTTSTGGFVGNLTGTATTAVTATSATTASYATTAGIATVAQGLTGTPDITVNQLTASRISAGSTTGISNQILRSTGTGIGWTTLSTGKILQVIQTVDQGGYWSTSSTSYVATNLSVSITPSSTSSKILVLATLSNITAANSDAMYTTIFRNSTNLATGAAAVFAYPAGAYGADSAAITFLDSPNTTGIVTYAVYAKTGGSIGYLGNSGNTSTIQVLEVGP